MMFSNRLKQLRQERGLTQVALARQLEISPGTIGNWEVGNREPDFDMVGRIADLFNVSIDYLLDREGAARELPPSPEHFGGTNGKPLSAQQFKELEQLAEIFSSLSPERQHDVLQFVRFSIEQQKQASE